MEEEFLAGLSPFSPLLKVEELQLDVCFLFFFKCL